MPVPASASSRLGAPFARLGAKTCGHRLGHRALALARLGPAGQPVELRARAAPGSTQHRPRRRPLGRFLPLLQPREQHALAALGPLEPRADQRRPAPAEPVQRRVRRPRAFALAPVRIAEHARAAARRSRCSDAAASASLAGGSKPERAAQARRGRHREPRRMDEGEQLEQVEPAQLGIAEPLPDQRRVEDDVRRLGGPRDRFAPARLAHLAVAARQPDPGMGCVQRGKRQRSGHPRDPAATRTEEQRIWTPKRFDPPRWRRRPGLTRKRASC